VVSADDRLTFSQRSSLREPSPCPPVSGTFTGYCTLGKTYSIPFPKRALCISNSTGYDKMHQSRCVEVKQLDDGIDDTLVSLDTSQERSERRK
jgi:hypothetical protein